MFRDVQDFVLNFSSILWEALPFIVLGAIIAGLLEELLPQHWISKFMPRMALPAVLIGGALGLIFPMCECGIVVVMRRLLRKGLPLSCCIAYMLAGPIVNVVVLMSTFVAFGEHGIGVEMVALRAGLGFVIACITGLVVHAVQRSNPNGLLKDMPGPKASAKAISLNLVNEPEPEEEKPAPKSLMQRINNITATALHDFMDITVFLILGAALAAFAKIFITPNDIQYLSREMPYLSIPAMMALAVILCLCSEADAFVAASFTEMSASSKLAFLVLGPMLDLKLILMYTSVFRLKLILTIITCTVTLTLLLTNALHFVYNPDPYTAAGGGTTVSTTSPTK
ncbi:MAG: permease [Fimbriiglobus sp.]